MKAARHGLWREAAIASLPVLILLGGCASVGPDYHQPPPPESGPGFHAAQDAATKDEEPPERWWESLHDPILNDLIGRAMRDNYDLKIATANLLAARAARDVASAQQFPAVNANALVQRYRESAAALLDNPSISAPDVNLTEVGVGVSWELDLFGRVRRSVEAANADLAQVDALRRQVFTILVADVASSYIDLRGAQLRLDVARHNAVNQRDTFDLTVTLNDAGRGTDLDVARARAQLESTTATIPPLEAQLSADKHNLALLIGMTPNALDDLLDPEAPLPTLPGFVAVGNPTSLLRRRPDVAAAERALAAATARIGVATADLYPTVTFSATPSLEALQFGDLTKRGAFTFGVGPSLTLPIFDLSIYARLRGAKANEQAALATFQKTILTALAETETALDLYVRERSRLDALAITSEASVRAADLASIRYQYGLENFLAVLDAEARELAAEDQLAQSKISVAQDLVTIYRALGGGWEVAPSGS